MVWCKILWHSFAPPFLAFFTAFPCIHCTALPCLALHPSYRLLLAVQGPQVLQAAPALLAMDPNTLAIKVKRLELLAAQHPKWAEVGG